MTYLKKIISKSKQIARKPKNLKIAAAITLGFTSLSGIYFFTDTITCHRCAYSQDGIRVYNAELDNAFKVRLTFYNYLRQDINQDTLKKDALAQLIEEEKIQKTAKDKKIKVSEKEVTDLYNTRVQQNGSEDKLLAKVRDMYGFTKAQYKEVLRKDILREKVKSKK